MTPVTKTKTFRQNVAIERARILANNKRKLANILKVAGIQIPYTPYNAPKFPPDTAIIKGSVLQAMKRCLETPMLEVN